MAKYKKTKEETKLEKQERKEFAKKIKALSSYEAKYSNRFEYTHVQEDGKAYINVDLTKVDTPFSVYSYENRIDPEIYNYIEQEAFFLNANIPLVVNFDDGGKYTNELKFKIARAVVRHYRLQYEETLESYRKNNILAIIFSGIGLILFSIFLLLNIFLGDKYVNAVVFEIFEIIAWAFIWEGVDRLFLSGTNNRINVFNAGQLALIEVTFGEPVYKTTK